MAKLTRRDRKAAETGEPKREGRKLTEEEQDDEDEKRLEEWCEKWCGRVIRLVTLGSLFWGLMTSVSEWAFRPPVILEPVSLAGRPPFVLTGGTEGIGAAAARRLALDGGRVVLGVRNMSKGEAFAAALRRETGNAAVHARHLDLTRLDSVVGFATELLEAEADGVAGVLNNAAFVEHEACGATIDGFERATQVNYLAPALLTTLLLPALEASGDGRAVHVTCPAAQSAKVDLSHLEALPPFEALTPDAQSSAAACDGFGRYASAKLMLTAFSATLSRRRTGAAMSITSNVYDPGGAINTPNYDKYQPRAAKARRMGFGPHVIIRKALGFVFAPLFAPIGRRLSRWAMRQAAEGGDGLAHLATSAHLQRVSGKIYSLAASGFTRASGCAARTRDECGLATPPTGAVEGMPATELWEETQAALAPWLDRSCANDATGTCDAARARRTAHGGRAAAAQGASASVGEWDVEDDE